MNLDGLFQEYFGTADLSGMTPAGRAAGIERMQVDFGLEKDRSRRFALWMLLYSFDAAPDLDVAFKDPADRNAARDMMDLLAAPDED
ncbi:MAG: hypothetical protein WA842_14000 [Croceibacterium sp.]